MMMSSKSYQAFCHWLQQVRWATLELLQILISWGLLAGSLTLVIGEVMALEGLLWWLSPFF